MSAIEDWQKERYRDVLKLMFETHTSQKAINMMIEATNYTPNEVEEIWREAFPEKSFVTEWYEEKHRADLKPSIVKALKKGATMEMLRPLLESANYSPEEIEGIRKEAKSE